MAVVMGKEGYVKIGSVTTSAVVCIDNWSLDMAADAIEVTAFGTGTAITTKAFDYGLKSSTGSLSGHYDAADANTEVVINMLASKAVENMYIDLYANAGAIASLAAVITGVSIGQTVQDKTALTINFTTDGAVAWT